MGPIVIVEDISGSIQEIEARHYAGHMTRIVETCRPSHVHVLYIDTQIKVHDEFEYGEEIEFKFLRGGGTDMTAAFRYLEEHGIEPDVLICLTDGYTPFGEEQSYPVVWCISSDVVPPHGVHIPFKLQDQ